MTQEMIEVPAGVKVADFPTGYGTPDEIIRHLIADRDAWKIIAKQNGDWNRLPQSEKEATLQKALDATMAENIRLQDELDSRGSL